MALTEFDHGITAIDTGFTRPEFDASHLIVRNGECAFVDTGTNFSIPHLLDAGGTAHHNGKAIFSQQLNINVKRSRIC